MEIFGLVVGDFFEYSHHEFELVLGHGNGGREVGFFPFGLGATLEVARPRGDGPLSTGALSACLLVVLIQPLLVTLVHVVDKSIVEPVGDGLFDSA